MKDARSEATREIEEYRRVKEDEFKAFEASHAGNISNVQVAVEKETDVKLQSISEVFETQKDQVLRKLLDRVVLIKPELHRNLKKGALRGSEEQ